MVKISDKLNQLLKKPISISEKFHNRTKIKRLDKNPADPSKWPKAWSTVFFKEYARLDKILLPEPATLDKISLEKALRGRKSSREFSKNPISLEELSTLLYYSGGLKTNTPPYLADRFYPSAGARYPLEVYLISQNTELPNGLYHYNLRSHGLEVLEKWEEFNPDKYFNQEFINKAGVIFLTTAVFFRNSMKYSNRGYRHILMEAGHLAQNFWLVSASLNLGICGVGGFTDDKLNALLEIDGISEAVLNVFVIGKIR
ncbi:SagB/ThcOx family dehydrogenase [Candidatus Daviesbacteria bacterium]|nr:SagB/ThcOx family dehydrogenase [Candidatus Daviesbacteria bacterium]